MTQPEVARLSTIDQYHSGSGDNVRDKIYNEIKSLAPSDLLAPMGLVFESIRRKDSVVAKIQIKLLKATAQRDPEAAALIEIISIYGGLVEAGDDVSAWGVVSEIASSTKNEIIKDVCLAALLRLSYKTERENAAKEYYLAESASGIYSKEAFLCFYADEAQLEAEIRRFIISEGELVGIVEGAFRVKLPNLAIQAANYLQETFPSYNASVLCVMANAFNLNKDISQHHLWLHLPEVKQKLDDLVEQVVELLDLSEGKDVRLYGIACPMYEYYQGLAPNTLFKALKKYLQYLETTYPATAVRFKAVEGEETDLSQFQRDLRYVSASPENRATWCKQFISANNHILEYVMLFILHANSDEISDWLSKKIPIDDASEMEVAFVRLLGCAFKVAGQDEIRLQSHQLADQVELFLKDWKNEIISIAPERIFDLAEKLLIARLPHKALSFTSIVIPDQALWPSPFILTHLRCLLEAEQYNTFNEVIARVSGLETSLTLINLQSLKAERMGEIEFAIELSDQMVLKAPENLHCWYRGCFLRYRYRTKTEQREFQQQIPDSLLRQYSLEAAGILYFLTQAGSFKRAEPLWVEWFIEAPRARAVELVNFHFGLIGTGTKRVEFDVSLKLEKCSAAFQYEQDGNTMVRLIVDDYQSSSEFTLKASSHLAKLLQSLSVGESGSLSMVNYKITELLPPYVACLRVALNLRHTHNDGSDCFAMLSMPSDPEQLVPFLEEKLGQDANNRKQLANIDNIPLYIRGHALHPDSAFKGGLGCWTDTATSKSMLFSQGEASPDFVVLDAYSIGYLAVTDLVKHLVDIGVSLVLPASTKEALELFIEEISSESFMRLGVSEGGKLYRTTASDVQARDGHTLRALRLILDNASVVYPVLHDTSLDVYSVKDGIDSTVYDAMQLSQANNIPWFCMDAEFAALHHSNQHATVNIHTVVMRAMASSPFDFEHKRHRLLLYALGTLPLPLTSVEIYCLAMSPNTLAGFILFKIIQNHGKQIFVGSDRAFFLLDVIFVHLYSWFYFGSSHDAVRPSYTLNTTYTAHVFNHGIKLFLKTKEAGTAELRIAVAIKYMMSKYSLHQRFVDFILGCFIDFAKGNFMDIEAIEVNLQTLANH